MDIFTIATLTFCGLFVVFLGLYWLHIAVASWQHSRVLNAVLLYVIDTDLNHHKKILVDLYDVEDVGRSMDRLWDWGYKNMLPPDKLAIIKPYIPMVTGSYGIEKILKGRTVSSIDEIATILRGGIVPMESKNISNTQKVASFDDIIPINDRPEPMDKMDNFDSDVKNTIK